MSRGSAEISLYHTAASPAVTRPWDQITIACARSKVADLRRFRLLSVYSSQKEDGMSLEKHDLVHEFPEYREKIHQLKTSDHHFARLFAQYHDIDHEVYRLEQGAETAAADYLEERKKLRLQLKDQLYQSLLQA
jgi:hypothetical protein